MSREAVLTRIRQALAGARPAAHPASEGPLVPGFAALGGEAMICRFIEQSEAALASLERIAEKRVLPEALARYLAAEGLSREVILADVADATTLDWAAAGVTPLSRPVRSVGDTVVTTALAGVAEAGLLVLAGGDRERTSRLFLADTLVVVLAAGEIVAGYEDLWGRLAAAGGIPSTLHQMRGPSRTADIEHISTLGAHGPGRVHILLLETPGQNVSRL